MFRRRFDRVLVSPRCRFRIVNPDSEKGFALGLNAAGGNIGVSSVQLLAPLIIGIGAVDAAHPHVQNLGLVGLPLSAVAALGAFFFMDNLATAKSNFADQVRVATNKQTWIMSVLYIGTFGSFVGYSAAFPLLLKTQFPEVTANPAFLGPLIGSASRPIGGWLSDKLGGSRVTFWNFLAMALATVGVLSFVHQKDFAGFLTMFLLLFVTTGIGNGSTFRMIPVIFRTERLRAVPRGDVEAERDALRAARRDAAAVIGLSSAIGALGGYFIPRSFGASIKATGGLTMVLGFFLGFYVFCLAMTWWHYRRQTFMVRSAPSLASADA